MWSPTSEAAPWPCSRPFTPTSPRRLASAALRIGVLDRAQPRRDAAVAARRGHPQGNAGGARLDPPPCPAHLRSSAAGESERLCSLVPWALGPAVMPSGAPCAAATCSEAQAVSGETTRRGTAAISGNRQPTCVSHRSSPPARLSPSASGACGPPLTCLRGTPRAFLGRCPGVGSPDPGAPSPGSRPGTGHCSTRARKVAHWGSSPATPRPGVGDGSRDCSNARGNHGGPRRVWGSRTRRGWLGP